ncbi:hypothetical protein F0919_02395 [Taibaiella lutea]|uniref:Uncharacterized protein n=1 Tax=Taibaiella lutea TaxID=2608001 RepID=A0A5M6CMU6_9BACT|nr:hypothetical protein [Taibaiella lutea]KAA5536538.1 hypothetical protein F0919_02395 [Taibaiella lutea]
MNFLVHSFAQNNELEKTTAELTGLATILTPFKVSLSNESRNGLRVVGTSRLGLVEIVAKLSTQYDNKLAKDDQAADLNQRLVYLRKLKACKLAAKNLCELLDDTDKALGNDVMTFVDKFSNSLRNARKYDGDLDEAMKELDDYNARFGKIIEDEDKESEAGNNPGETSQ